MSSPSKVKAVDPDSFSLISAMTDAKTLERALVARKLARSLDFEGAEGRKRRHWWMQDETDTAAVAHFEPWTELKECLAKQC